MSRSTVIIIQNHRIPLGCSCLMTTTLPEAILPTLPTQYFGGRATGWVIIRQLFDTRRCTKQLILRVTLLDLQVAGLQGCASTLGPKSFWRGRDSNPGLLLSWQALYQLSYWPPRQKWVPAHLTNASKLPPASQIHLNYSWPPHGWNTCSHQVFFSMQVCNLVEAHIMYSSSSEHSSSL